MKRPAALLLVVALATTAACTRTRVTFGHPVHPDDAQWVVEGVAKAAVLERLGPPDRVDVEPGGSIFEYYYSESAQRELDISIFQGSFSYDESYFQLDKLRISFDTTGKVRHVGIVPGELSLSR